MHYQLVPYLLTTGSEAYENGRSSLSPLAKHDSFIDKVITLGVSLAGIGILPRHLLYVECIPGKEDRGRGLSSSTSEGEGLSLPTKSK